MPEEPKSSKTLVGAYVPRSVSDYLTLYAIACSCTKSKIVRQLLDNWYNEKGGILPMEDLCTLLTNRYSQEWVAIRLKDCEEKESLYRRFIVFKQEKTKELEEQKVPSEFVKKIIKSIDI